MNSQDRTKLLGGQKRFRDGEEFGMSDTDADANSETEKLPNHSNDLLKYGKKCRKKTQNGKGLGERLRKSKKQIEGRIKKDWNN